MEWWKSKGFGEGKVSDMHATTGYNYYARCAHKGDKLIPVGGFFVRCGASFQITPEIVGETDFLISLNGQLPDMYFGQLCGVVSGEMTDMGGVPENWKDFVENIAGLIKDGHRILIYCTGGHGRTGTLLASLISLMEPDCEDPIQAARDRHCWEAVETLAQARGIYKLRDLNVPEKYVEEFLKYTYTSTTSYGTPLNNTVGTSQQQTLITSTGRKFTLNTPERLHNFNHPPLCTVCREPVTVSDWDDYNGRFFETHARCLGRRTPPPKQLALPSASDNAAPVLITYGEDNKPVETTDTYVPSWKKNDDAKWDEWTEREETKVCTNCGDTFIKRYMEEWNNEWWCKWCGEWHREHEKTLAYLEEDDKGGCPF